MERIKHLKLPNNNNNNLLGGGNSLLVNRNRSQSIDMIVMDEVSKHGTLTTWNHLVNDNNNNTELINSESRFNTPINNNLQLNNYNNSSNNNNNNNNFNNNSTPTLLVSNNIIFNHNKNRSNSATNLNSSNINNSNNFGITINNNSNSSPNSLNNTIHQPNHNNINNNNNNSSQKNFSIINPLNFQALREQSGSNSVNSSPPLSPRNSLMNTAPNLSSFIAQHTPPPSPRLYVSGGDLQQQLVQQQQQQQGSSKSLSNSNSSLPGLPSSPTLNNSRDQPFRNDYSFNSQKISSMQSLDMTLSKSISQSSSHVDSSSIQNSTSQNSQNGANNVTGDKDKNNSANQQQKKKKRENKTVRRLKRFLSRIILSPFWAFLMILFIVYILFIDDIIGICRSPSSTILNIIVIAIKLLVMLFFTLDMIGNSICYQSQYIPHTIIFWLDLLSTLSIIPDIYMFFQDVSLGHSYLVLSIGKSARIIRLCGCFLQISFISFFYKKFFKRNNPTVGPLSGDELEVEASKLGEKLIRLTTNKLVLLVLLVYWAGQLLTYPSELPAQLLKSQIDSLEFMSLQFGITSDTFNNYLDNYIQSTPELLTVQINNTLLFQDQPTIDKLQLYSQFDYSTGNSKILLNNSETIFYTSILHLVFTIFTIVIIMIINLFIVIDAYGLVINPLENVLAIVKFLSRQNAVMQKSTALKIQTRDRVESVGNKSEDTTSSSADVDDPDEADYLLGMLNDIDDSLQAAKEKVQVESIQNSLLKKDIEDLYVEKYILQVHLRSVIRKAPVEDDPIGSYLKKKQLALLSDTLPFADDIRFKGGNGANDQTNIVVAGTLDALVDRLTLSENHDLKFTNIFLLTFRKFMSPIELMERLIIRFCVTPTMELPEKQLESPDQVEQWRKLKQEQIRVSVFNTLKLWIGKYNWDFYENQELLELFNNLVQRIMPFCKMERYASHLDSFLKRKMTNYQNDPEFTPLKVLTSEEIAHMMVMEDRVLYNFDIHDVAIQITLIEFDLFKAVKPQEFLDLAWTSKTKTVRAPNICKFIDHFNNVSFWLQTLLVKSGKVKDRVSILKKIIALGESFVQLNNFYGAMEVLSSLESSSIARLHRTWEMLPAASSQSLQNLQKLLSPMGSFKEYRERLKLATSACIPYIGVFLSDLTFIHEGNPDMKEGTLINFLKQKDIASIILSIQQYQNTYYYFEVNEKITKELNMRGIDSDTIWKMSLTAEPRRN
ncbi:RasGEF domain-containing protein [Tieghemostelium lacteum]|uniref:RasGEF domain-containing protein n=1 Tax=Tieghemostelium lacteum TaxID=361077 RepID=A0A151ZDR0_TIELA|nr:RasGEF domain-containing protein [Tieghemostelium lacteum]|eukprot:KYQ92065.1 RasGEF domain-containing protein [Tieghemostelium lacteum]